MTEQQFKRWMIAKTRQYIWLITKKDPNRVKIVFMKSFGKPFTKSHGVCNYDTKEIFYRTDYIKNGWDCNLDVLENLVIHEVCHLKYFEHDGNFFTLYKQWSGDDFIERWLSGPPDDGNFVSNVVGLPRDSKFLGV